MRNLTKIYILPLLLTIVCSCANRGIGPQGGPVDSIPPVLVKSTPVNGTLNFHDKHIELVFNEYIQLVNPAENVILSPPQQRPPEIKAVGKKIRIDLVEPLQDSTTYTIDFGSAIVDNNEKNAIEDFSLSFSTGDQIDSLEIYGQVINAEDLNPISGLVIGIHENVEDSAFEKIPFTRIGRTNEEGEFAIRNIKTGSYRLYALQDASRDFLYQPGEGLAFSEEIIEPYINIRVETDTIWGDSIGVDSTLYHYADSVYTAEYYYYEPSNLVMFFFQEDKHRTYFQRANRNEAHQFSLYFSAAQTENPQIEALRLENDSLGMDTTWVDFTQHCLIQTNLTRDTFTYWLTDSVAIRMDSIRFAMKYQKSDSLFQMYTETDTIMAIYRAPRMSDKAREAQARKRQQEPLHISSNAKRGFEVYDTLAILCTTPIKTIHQDSIHLQHKVDTTWQNIPFEILMQSQGGINEAKRKAYILAKLTPNETYQLTVDSAGIFDIYGKWNKQEQYTLQVRSLEEYATLVVRLEDFTPEAYIVLLDDKDKPVRQMQAQTGGCKFEYLMPKTYYLRMFIDQNGDGKWTTGDWMTKRQPEPVYYFPKKLNLRANWDFEETFSWKSIPQLEQKPNALRKDAGKKK